MYWERVNRMASNLLPFFIFTPPWNRFWLKKRQNHHTTAFVCQKTAASSFQRISGLSLLSMYFVSIPPLPAIGKPIAGFLNFRNISCPHIIFAQFSFFSPNAADAPSAWRIRGFHPLERALKKIGYPIGDRNNPMQKDFLLKAAYIPSSSLSINW